MFLNSDVICFIVLKRAAQRLHVIVTMAVRNAMHALLAIPALLCRNNLLKTYVTSVELFDCRSELLELGYPQAAGSFKSNVDVTKTSGGSSD